ncbi:macrolide family glycosyltransferase [Kitasatospora sp. NPDC056783]|uniref:macrolide family glycosyltransferase n=1 Tax=Kitasatospora sp. NPDC056783 TaxID=3345943 RepID=UPI0036B92CEE
MPAAARTRASGRHVWAVTHPTPGHVYSSLGLVAELVRRGHRVTAAVTERFGAAARSAGAAVTGYRSPLEELIASGRLPTDGDTHDPFLTEARAVLPQLAATLDRDRPDLLLYKNGCWQAPLLAHTRRVPAIQFTTTRVPRPDLHPAGPRFHTQLRTLLSDHGVTTTAQDFLDRPETCLVMLPPSFQPHRHELGGHHRFVGPCFGDRSFQGSWQSRDGKNVLLIALGGVFTDRPDFYRRCLEAFGDGEWDVVMATGDRTDPRHLGAVPPNVHLHRTVPQLRVLAHAVAFVSHCGGNSTMEALHHGVPLVAVPQAVDQFENAARIAELGLGIDLSGADADPGRLREAAGRRPRGRRGALFRHQDFFRHAHPVPRFPRPRGPTVSARGRVSLRVVAGGATERRSTST